jgi:hypothetical protein
MRKMGGLMHGRILVQVILVCAIVGLWDNIILGPLKEGT